MNINTHIPIHIIYRELSPRRRISFLSVLSHIELLVTSLAYLEGRVANSGISGYFQKLQWIQLWQPHNFIHIHGLKYLTNSSVLACLEQFPHGNIIKFSRLASKALTSKSPFNNNSFYQKTWIDLWWNWDN